MKLCKFQREYNTNPPQGMEGLQDSLQEDESLRTQKRMYRKQLDSIEKAIEYFKRKSNKMKTITLENGKKVEISEESYKALEGAVKEVTWEDVWKWAKDEGETDVFSAVRFGWNHQDKVKAIHRLLIAAKYLNGDWKPDWKKTRNYFLAMYEGMITIDSTLRHGSSFVYFKSSEAAKRAVSILGEETIRAAFNTDW